MADLAPRARPSQPSQQYPSPSSITGGGTTSAPSTDTQPDSTKDPSLLEYEALKSRIRQLEERLSSSAGANDSSPLTLKNSIMGTLHVHRQGQFPGQHAASQNITNKGRLLGRSHWLNTFIPVGWILMDIEAHH